ncbi:MAG: carboxypeptidase regulatory-like domain-containing protein [Planctomycetota bacterium]
MSAAKIVAPLLLLAAIGGGAYYFLSKSTDPVVAPTDGSSNAAGEANPGGQDPGDQDPGGQNPSGIQVAQSGSAGQSETPTPVERTELSGPSGQAHSDAPQGIKGRIMLPDGQPAVGVSVILMENAMNDAVKIFLRNQRGQTSTPLAVGETMEDGSFALGVLKPGKPVDLRVVSPAHPEISRSNLRVRRDDWYDAGDLKLTIGVTVQGRVLDAATQAPIADATVYMKPSNSSHSLIATPGRERGTPVLTDGGGFFRFDNAPREGLVNLTVESEGFASTKLLNQTLRTDSANEFTLQIERGRSITGVVVDEAGGRLRGVDVSAYGLSTKTPQTATVRTDKEGEFRFDALHSGPYRLTANAKQFSKVEMPIALTDEDVKIVMQQRGRVKLKVLSAGSERPVKVFRLSLKRTFPNNPDGIGNVLDFDDRNINPRNYEDGWAIIDGLPSGTFRFQLTERNHAKTLSPVFEVREGGEVVEVVAVLTMGAAITGKVIDDRGNPVRGATVSSDMNSGLAAGSELMKIFGSMVPKKHTSSSVKTDAQGNFRLSRLAFAEYMVRVSHPAFCEGSQVNIKLTQEGQVLDAGVIELQRGTIVEGFTTVTGAPAGQVKVVISMPTKGRPKQLPGKAGSAEQKSAAARMLFSANALSDGNGRYALLKRVPPGVYKITAARHSAENPFRALLDMKQTERELIIPPGQDRISVDFDLQAN